MVQLVTEGRKTYECPFEPQLQPYWGPVGAVVAEMPSVVMGGFGKFVADWSL